MVKKQAAKSATVTGTSQTSGKVGSAGGEGKTTLELQAPTSEIGIYANWHADRWDFGTSRQYPALKYAGLDLSAHAVSLF